MVEIRNAKPNDKGDIAELIYSSGKELYDYIYETENNSAIDYIRFEYESGDGFCGYKNVTLAVDGTRVLGTGCFYGGQHYNRLMIGSLKNMFRFFGPIKAWRVLRRSSRVGSVMKVPKKGELYLSNFGVIPESRGKGVGSKMISNKMIIAKDKNYRVFALDVADNNPKAEALYSRLGLEVVEVKKFSDKRVSMPSVKKMEVAL
ncbi:MAG: GNAT family N-acetyltransferase [Pseudomonadales bacterium]|nr:GNAT family N-acetyltransferase [Pseudomonadales bacterium]